MEQIKYDVVATGLEFPEGPVALADGTLLVVELAGQRLTRIGHDGVKATVAELGGAPNGAAIGADGLIYVCNNGGVLWGRNEHGILYSLGVSEDYTHGSIQRVDLRTGKSEVVFTHCGDHALKAPNDLVFDRQGGLWFTDFGKTYDRGGIYYALPSTGHIREVIYPMNKPNGIALSPAEDRLYVAETDTGRVWSFELEAPGQVRPGPKPPPHGGTLLAGLVGFQLLDSMAIDVAGNVCVATLMNGGITVIAPDGAVLRQIGLPDRHVTNICFGGPDLTTAYVTLSDSGSVISFPWKRPGLRLNFSELCVPASL